MINIIRFILLVFVISSCVKEPLNLENTPENVIKTLWQYADENYVYFDFKNINWDLQKEVYLDKVSNTISEDSLFSICTSMISELKDGHCFFIREGDFFMYDFTQGYDVYFELEHVKNNYLDDNIQQNGVYTYATINDTIGYLYYENFIQGDHLVEVMEFFDELAVSKIIIDIRNNSGGDPAIAIELAGYFVNKATNIGSITHKGGIAHDDFSSQIELLAIPQAIYFDKKVNVLINRKSFSASSYFAGMIKYFPKIDLIGQITGGGGGGEADFELPNGWVASITSNFYLDAEEVNIENGNEPSVIIENTLEDFNNEIDRMLEKAINY